MWRSLAIKRALLTVIGLFVLNRVGVRNHWWRNPSWSAWNIGMAFNTLSLFLFFFFHFLSGCRLHCLLFLPSFASYFCRSRVNFAFIFSLVMSFSAFHFLYLCSKSTQCVCHHCKKKNKIPDWNTLLIEKSGKGKKNSPASLAPLPVQFLSLPLCSLIMLGLTTLRHLNQCLMLPLCTLLLASLGSHCQDQWT